MKTNATRILDSLNIKYELRAYEVDPDHLDAETVAAKVGMPAEQVFKTLVVKGEGRDCYFAVIPGNTELDLKKLAKQAGERKIEMAPLKDVQTLTGYIRGGVTVMGAKKDFHVYLDETAYLFDIISVSAGVRGTQILINPEDYIRVTQATPADISKA
jgi:Cys-tRNA(Pro)/Cys-tRNA(Cys) deacylase